MIICDSIDALEDALANLRDAGKTVALVPTMGNLHAGHLQLVKTAQQHADCVVVSLFVNPTQFAANEDLGSYPRTLQQDIEKLNAFSTDILFTPSEKMMYPLGGVYMTHVHVPALTTILCGASRPNHFDGVTTVVAKLFNIVQASVAVFGEKDFQQLAVIRRMVKDLNIPVNIIGEPIVRERDGLAMSSRNGYLTDEQRRLAPLMHKTLLGIEHEICNGNKDFVGLAQSASHQLNQLGFRTDYINILNKDDLKDAQQQDTDLIAFAAAFLGTTRLIDNQVINCQ